MAKPKTPESAMLDQFALDTGKPLRTARHHRQHRSPDWLAWLATRGSEICADSKPAVTDLPSAPTSDPLERAMSVECQAWATLSGIERQKALAIISKKPDLIVGWTTAWLQAFKAYREARSDRRRVELETGRTRPAADVDRERSEFAGAIRELFRAQPAEVGPQANPTHPQLAIRALQRWFTDKLQPLLLSLTNVDAQKNLESAPLEGAGDDGQLSLRA